MATKWVITTPSDRIDLDDTRQAQTTFTVTNPSNRADRLVFDIVPGDDADPSWFTVDEPQRRVPAGGSVSYLMKTAVPEAAAAGTYSVQGRAYSADSAPEEDSVLSRRLTMQVTAPEAPAPRKRPWWILAAAGLAVAVLLTVGLVIALRQPQPHAAAGPAMVAVPDLTRQSLNQAAVNLKVFGLRVGNVRHAQSKTPDQVLYQSIPGGTKTAKGTPIDLVVTTALTAPKPTAPASGARVPVKLVAPPITPIPTNPPATPSAGATSGKPSATPTASGTPAGEQGLLRWTQRESFVTRWQVTIIREVCGDAKFGGTDTSYCPLRLTTLTVRVDHPWYTPILPDPRTEQTARAQSWAWPFGAYLNLTMQPQPTYLWSVAPLDDFGNAGPASSLATFTVQ